MPYVDIWKDAYPEQVMGALREELRRAERVEEARRDAQVRRQEWRERMRRLLLGRVGR